jgi:plasmid stabilization system protein ParE
MGATRAVVQRPLKNYIQSRFTQGPATRHREGIYRFISDTDSVQNADAVLDKLLKIVDSLSRFPERGAFPQELMLRS